jgi:hypothetical protein
MSATEKKKPWRNSKAKDQLIKDLKDGTIPVFAADMPPLVAYRSRQVYQDHDYEQFRDHLNDLRKKIREKKDRSFQDAAALEHDRAICPKAMHDHRGFPKWDVSEAQKLLSKDVEDGKDKTCSPQELWHSNDAYKEFPLEVFRGHIYQERRRQKFLKWLEGSKKT